MYIIGIIKQILNKPEKNLIFFTAIQYMNGANFKKKHLIYTLNQKQSFGIMYMAMYQYRIVYLSIVSNCNLFIMSSKLQAY